MYTLLLSLHSFNRWLVLCSLLYAIVRGYQGWRSKKVYTLWDNSLRHWTATIAHIQLLLGLVLYWISPISNYFLNNFKEAVHQREIRFFGMEHSLMMVLAIVLLTIGSAKARRKGTDLEKFKTMAIWYSIALLVILSSIPWPYSPLVSRPFFRY